MKGLLNNALSIRTLKNLMKGVDEIYNQGYREGYKDATEEILQNIKDEILEKEFNDLNGEPLTEEDLEEEIDDQA